MASDVISLQGSAGSVTVAPLGLEPPAVDSLDDLEWNSSSVAKDLTCNNCVQYMK